MAVGTVASVVQGRGPLRWQARVLACALAELALDSAAKASTPEHFDLAAARSAAAAALQAFATTGVVPPAAGDGGGRLPPAPLPSAAPALPLLRSEDSSGKAPEVADGDDEFGDFSGGGFGEGEGFGGDDFASFGGDSVGVPAFPPASAFPPAGAAAFDSFEAAPVASAPSRASWPSSVAASPACVRLGLRLGDLEAYGALPDFVALHLEALLSTACSAATFTLSDELGLEALQAAGLKLLAKVFIPATGKGGGGTTRDTTHSVPIYSKIYALIITVDFHFFCAGVLCHPFLG